MFQKTSLSAVAVLCGAIFSQVQAADNMTQYQDEARSVVKTFGQTLGGELKKPCRSKDRQLQLAFARTPHRRSARNCRETMVGR